jgi:hypothetical protein
VDIAMNGTSIHSFVEPSVNDSGKWRRILNEGRTITTASQEKLVDALSSSRAKLSKRQIDVATKEIAELNQSLLWSSLKQDLKQEDINDLYDELPYQIKRIVLKPSTYSDHFYRFDHCPGSVKINKVEKIGSYNALAALLLLLRDKRYRIEKSADEHIHRAVFRLLLSFFQHPSFYRFRHEIWAFIRKYIMRLEPSILEKMGLGFWAFSMEKIEALVAEEAQLLKKAIYANIVEDFKDSQLFFFLLYRNADCLKIIEALESIYASQPTSMERIDMFFIRFTENRRRGNSKLQAPSITFESLAIL